MFTSEFLNLLQNAQGAIYENDFFSPIPRGEGGGGGAKKKRKQFERVRVFEFDFSRHKISRHVIK